MELKNEPLRSLRYLIWTFKKLKRYQKILLEKGILFNYLALEPFFYFYFPFLQLSLFIFNLQITLITWTESAGDIQTYTILYGECDAPTENRTWYHGVTELHANVLDQSEIYRMYGVRGPVCSPKWYLIYEMHVHMCKWNIIFKNHFKI